MAFESTRRLGEFARRITRSRSLAGSADSQAALSLPSRWTRNEHDDVGLRRAPRGPRCCGAGDLVEARGHTAPRAGSAGARRFVERNQGTNTRRHDDVGGDAAAPPGRQACPCGREGGRKTPPRRGEALRNLSSRPSSLRLAFASHLSHGRAEPECAVMRRPVV